MKKIDTFLNVSEHAITYPVKAKYYIGADGIPILAQVQKFNEPRFKPSGWESVENNTGGVENFVENFVDNSLQEDEKDAKYDNIGRATRRAKITAFDAIMCNHDLDTFVTFTYSPDKIEDKASYDDCYKVLGVWLSNRVQRKDLKYVMVPEHTKKGDIHFHAIMNSKALKLEKALSPKTGRPLTHNGKPLYNVTDWKYGFTSAELIPEAIGDRTAVAKYIFKYMGKQMGQKIGGRYVLTGGELHRPYFAYGEDEEEFFDGENIPKYSRCVAIDDGNLVYSEWSFI